MTQVNMHEAKTHFSKLVTRVLQGEEVVIAKSGKPVAKLVPIDPEPKERIPGSARGVVEMADDFNAPLPDDVLADFDS